MNKKSAFIALAGAANAGKSTLLNQLIGTPLAVVSAKPQTTRRPVTGVMTQDNAQLAFTDTAGLLERPEDMVQKAMHRAAHRVIEDADIIIFLLDIKTYERDRIHLHSLKKYNKPLLIALNKIDTATKDRQLPILQELAEFDYPVFPISARKNHGVGHLLESLIRLAPEGEWHYDEQHLTDAAMRMLAEEITRGEILRNCHQEVPHSTSVFTEKWEEKRNGIHIYQQIITPRDSHKRIIVGRQGQMLKKIGGDARKEIAALAGCPCHLFLHVKVVERWQEEEAKRII